MKQARKRVTLLHLLDYVWWWRKETANSVFDELTHTTRLKPGAELKAWRQDEIVAFRYELAKRDDREANYPPLIRAAWLAEWLRDIDPLDRQQAFRVNMPDIVEKSNRFKAFPDIEWNLAAKDKVLSDAFLRHINAARPKHGIKPMKGPKNRRNAPAPWRWVELIDIADLIPQRPLTKSEVDTLRKARALAEQCAAHIRSSIPTSDEWE